MGKYKHYRKEPLTKKQVAVSLLNTVFLRYVPLVIVAFVMIFPFLWLLSLALREGGDLAQITLIPKGITLYNFSRAWEYANIGVSFKNSTILATLAISGNLFLGALAAYPLARYRFRGRNIVFIIILSSMMIPFQLTMIPLSDIIAYLHLNDTLFGVALPGLVSAVGVFLIRQSYLIIPKDLESAARIDGAGEFRIWWQIMLPQVKPAMATLAIFVFVASWGDLLWPLIVLQDESKYTLPVNIAYLTGMFGNELQTLSAACVITIVPVIVLFLFLQRYFIEGLSMGSVKG